MLKSDRPGINSIFAISQFCDLDKLFIVLEILFPYL